MILVFDVTDSSLTLDFPLRTLGRGKRVDALGVAHPRRILHRFCGDCWLDLTELCEQLRRRGPWSAKDIRDAGLIRSEGRPFTLGKLIFDTSKETTYTPCHDLFSK